MSVLARLLNQLVDKRYAPFGNVSEVLITQAIHATEAGSQGARLPEIIDRLGIAVSRNNMGLSLGSLEKRGFITANDNSYTLTQTGKEALNRVKQHKKADIQAHLNNIHSGFAL